MRAFRFTWLDVFVATSFGAAFVSLTVNEPFSKVLIREGGTFLDAVLPYFIARLLIRTREDIYRLIKGFLVISIPVALVGAIQSVSGTNLYSFLEVQGEVGEDHMRLGLHRADASFGNAIPFGLFFTAVIPLVVGLWHTNTLKKIHIVIGVALGVAGVFSSLSSAPVFALVACVGFLCFHPVRRYWFFLVAGVVICISAVELYSNRHFYHVLTRFAFSSSTGYYRIELVEEALGGGMDGHWLFGYGYVGMGTEDPNPEFDWVHQDLVNVYIGDLAQTGLVGLIPALVLHFAYYRRLYVAGKHAPTAADKWLVWCTTAALVNWNIAMMTVNPMRQIQTILPILYALCAAFGFVWSRYGDKESRSRTRIREAHAGGELREWAP